MSSEEFESNLIDCFFNLINTSTIKYKNTGKILRKVYTIQTNFMNLIRSQSLRFLNYRNIMPLVDNCQQIVDQNTQSVEAEIEVDQFLCQIVNMLVETQKLIPIAG